MEKTIVAFESANSFVKSYSNGDSMIYPNTVSDAILEQFDKLKGEEKEDCEVVYQLDDDGYNYNVGRTFDYSTSSSSSIKRYSSDAYKRESLTAIARLIKGGETIVASTGIPSNHYGSKDDITKAINDNLCGFHKMVIDGELKEFTVSAVLVTLQPLASFFYCVIDELGNSNEMMIKRFQGNKTLVVDIGWGTTDVAVCVSNGLSEYISVKTSMKKAYEKIAQRIKTKFKGRKIASHTFELFDLEKQLRESFIIEHANEKYDCTDIVDSVMEKTCADLVGEISNLRSFEDYKTVIFTGGGTSALQENIKDTFTNEKGELDENIFIILDSQIANVKGYYVFAKYLQ